MHQGQIELFLRIDDDQQPGRLRDRNLAVVIWVGLQHALSNLLGCRDKDVVHGLDQRTCRWDCSEVRAINEGVMPEFQHQQIP